MDQQHYDLGTQACSDCTPNLIITKEKPAQAGISPIIALGLFVGFIFMAAKKKDKEEYI